jgi:hypothetical protein
LFVIRWLRRSITTTREGTEVGALIYIGEVTIVTLLWSVWIGLLYAIPAAFEHAVAATIVADSVAIVALLVALYDIIAAGLGLAALRGVEFARGVTGYCSDAKV